MAVACLLATPAAEADGFIVVREEIVVRPIRPPRPRPPRWNGLFPLWVEQHHVKVTIDGQVATTEIDQTFRNPLNQRLEGTYMFPLPEDAAVTDFSIERLALASFCFGMIVIGLFARVFPLGVQDRVIRLEERMRFAEILPDDLKGRIGELKESQLIGLRFASDEEAPDLVRRILDGELTELEEIKKAIKTWRPDYFRC